MKEKIANFINSTYFIIFINIITFFFWYLGNPKYGFLAYYIYLISFIFIIYSDAKRETITTLILNGLISFRVASTNDFKDLYKQNFILLAPLVIVAVGIVIYDYFKKGRQKIDIRNEILYGMFLILISFVLSLINTNQDTILLTLMGIAQIIIYIIIFIYFYNIKDDQSSLYISKTATFLGLVIIAQMAAYTIINKDSSNAWSSLVIGWGNRNSISIMLMALMPLSFNWYFHDQKNVFPLLIVLTEFLSVLLLLSRGAYMTFCITLIPFIFIIFLLIYDRKKMIFDIIYLSIIIFLSFVGFIFFTGIKENILELLRNKIDRGSDLSDRLVLYKVGISLFKENPLFGAGAYTGDYYLRVVNNYAVGTYHSYIIHALATTGIVGFLSFIYYLYVLIKKSLSWNFYNISVLFVVVNFIIYGLVDNTYFNPMFMIVLSIVVPFLNTKSQPLFLKADLN